ncbi:MAG: hypothetical protein EOM91_01695 [Sphingobacteriia bacterium]|nr:hypothetical protein [Sphingobacteriia bacterium]NCC38816.1 hypothetical protein [Gammaproteobacteria bacterium]
MKVIEQPIGVGEAFWRPYKRIGRMFTEQIQKFPGAHDQAVTTSASEGLTAVASTPAVAPAAPFDIAKFAGIFAALGLAVGAICTAFATLLASLFNLLLILFMAGTGYLWSEGHLTRGWDRIQTTLPSTSDPATPVPS